MTMEIQEALQVTAEWYGRTWPSRMTSGKPSRWAALQKELIERAEIRQGSRILDVGTGTGRTTLAAAKVTGTDGGAVGIDNARELMDAATAEARSQHIGNAVFTIGDISSLPFAAETFDHVISSFAINGIHPMGSGLTEAHRVLKPSGSLAFSMFGAVREGNDALAVVQEVFRDHQPETKSPLLQRLAEAFAVAPFGFCTQGPLSEPADPYEVVDFLRSVGFGDVEAAVTYTRVVSPDKEGAVDFFLGGRLDYAEMSERERAEARQRCGAGMESIRRDEGFVLLGQYVVYVTATKLASSR